jgi:hypothetical protein
MFDKILYNKNDINRIIMALELQVKFKCRLLSRVISSK